MLFNLYSKEALFSVCDRGRKHIISEFKMKYNLNTYILLKQKLCKWQATQYMKTHRRPTSFYKYCNMFLGQVKANSSLLQRNSLSRSKVHEDVITYNKIRYQMPI